MNVIGRISKLQVKFLFQRVVSFRFCRLFIQLFDFSLYVCLYSIVRFCFCHVSINWLLFSMESFMSVYDPFE